MKYLLTVLLVVCSFVASAHNMQERVKKEKIIEVLRPFSHQISYYDIRLEFSEYNLTFAALKDKSNSGDQDIEEFFAKIDIDNTPYEINCDIITGEYITIHQSTATYYMVFKNCTKKNLEDYKKTKINFDTVQWDDWIY